MYEFSSSGSQNSDPIVGFSSGTIRVMAAADCGKKPAQRRRKRRCDREGTVRFGYRSIEELLAS